MSEEYVRPRPEVSVGQISAADLQEAMGGTNGNPSYEQQFGQTTGQPGQSSVVGKSIAELELEAEIAQARALNPGAQLFQPNALQPETDQFAQELANFKKLYGDSENEKGQLRRQYQELQESFAGLMAQFEAMQSNQPPQGGFTAQPQQQPFQPFYQPSPSNVLASLMDKDIIGGKELKELFETELAPVLGFLAQQNQVANQRSAYLERQLAQQAKLASGITQQEEWRLIGKHPWLRTIADPTARLEAMKGLKQGEAAATTSQLPTSMPQPQAPGAQAQRVLSNVTYIEGSKPQVQDNSQAALDAAYQRDVAKVMSLSTEDGSRARGFRELAKKYNLSFTTPSDLGR